MNSFTRKLVTGAVGILLLCSGSMAGAATGFVTSLVDRTLIDDSNFGGCMISVASLPPNLDCGTSTWVTTSCTGDFNSANMGFRKFEVAQLAQALGKQITLTVDDSRKHNGRCFVRRIVLAE